MASPTTIVTVTAVPVYKLTIAASKTAVKVGEAVTFSGDLKVNGVGVGGEPIDLHHSGVAYPVGTTTTFANGHYLMPPWVADEVGTFTFHTSCLTVG